MRLPGYKPGPVPGPVRADVAAATAPGRGLAVIGEGIQDIAKVVQTYARDKEFNEKSMEAASNLTALQTVLLNEPNIPIDDLPEGIEHAESGADFVGPQNPLVPTHEVANQIWDQEAKVIIDETIDSSNDPAVRARLRNQLTGLYARGQAEVIKHTYKAIHEAGQASAMKTVEEAVRLGLPEMGRSAIIRQAALGNISEVEAFNLIQAMEGSIATRGYMEGVEGATNTGEIDVIISEAPQNSELKPEQIKEVIAAAKNKRNRLDEQDAERYSDGLTSGFIEMDTVGMTMERLTKLLSTDQINNSGYQTLLARLQSGANTTSIDRAAQSEIDGMISTIGRVGQDPALNVELQVRGFMLAVDGMLADGQISGSVALASKEKIRLAGDRATKGAYGYSAVASKIRSQSNLTFDVDGKIIGAFTDLDIEIYGDWIDALEDYANYYGNDADFQEFFDINRDRFTADFYKAKRPNRIQIFMNGTNFNTSEAQIAVSEGDSDKAEMIIKDAIIGAFKGGTISQQEANDLFNRWDAEVGNGYLRPNSMKLNEDAKLFYEAYMGEPEVIAP